MKPIGLRSDQFLFCDHPDLDNPFSIIWDSSNRTLRIDPLTNVTEAPKELFANLIKYKYVLLNPDYEDYQWKLQINVNKKAEAIEIKIIERPKIGKSDIRIINKQKNIMTIIIE